MDRIQSVSADSHTIEPPNLWLERIEQRFRDRAPRVIHDQQRNGHFLVAEGIHPLRVAGNFAAGRKGEALRDFLGSGFEAAPASCWDVPARIQDQDSDGVLAEVLYPTLSLALFALADGELQRACFSVYNDWVAEYCAERPERLYGIGMISLEDVAAGIRELERIARKDLRGALISVAPPPERPYSDPQYDPFWQAAAELRMPLSLHVVTSSSRDNKINWAQPSIWYVLLLQDMQRALTEFVFGGVLERFPQLNIVSVENDVGWIPHFIQRMDHAYTTGRALERRPLQMPPSYYIRRQLFSTFQDDTVGASMCHLFGEENYMWGSDFPHLDSTFPHSQRAIASNFQSVSAQVRHKIVYENAVRLFRMTLPSM